MLKLIFKNKKVVIFTILLITLLFYVLNSANKLKSTNTGIPSNMPVAVIDTNRLLFVNNRYFVDYNFRSGDSKKITPDATLPNISNMSLSPNRDVLLFYADNITSNDELGKILNNNNLNGVNSGWWLLNLKTAKFIYLNTQISFAFWCNRVDICAFSNSYSQTQKKYLAMIDFYKNNYIEPYKQIDTNKSNVSSVIPISNNFLISYINELGTREYSILDNTGKTLKNMDNISSILKASGSGRYISSYISNDSKSGNLLKLVDVDNNKVFSVDKKDETNGIWNNDSFIYINNKNKPSLVRYDLMSNKKKNYKIKGVNLNNIDLDISIDVDHLLINNHEEYLITSRKKDVYKNNSVSKFKTINKDKEGIIIKRLEEANTLNVYYTENDIIRVKQDVYKYIKQSGFNPDLYKIYFVKF